MQDRKTRKRSYKRLTARGKNGIINGFIQQAKNNISSRLTIFDYTGRGLTELESEYISLQEDINISKYGKVYFSIKGSYNGIPIVKNELKPELRRIMSRIIKNGYATQSDLDYYKLDPKYLDEEIKLRDLYINFLLKVTSTRKLFYKALKETAESGHYVDFDTYPDCIVELEKEIIVLEKALRSIGIDAPEGEDNEDYEQNSQITVSQTIENIPVNEDYHSLRRKLSIKRLHLRDVKQPILNAKIRERSSKENICYYLFYNGNHKNKSHDDFINKVRFLSKTNLEKLIGEYCKFQNEIHKSELTANRESDKKMAYKPKKALCTQQKHTKIKTLKAEGKKQYEVAKELNVCIRTVKYYWNK